ncbi:MAG: peptidoglycan bridge formation glycyltransferase FemA/FemB family protein, partial [Chloroflexota bacterium]
CTRYDLWGIPELPEDATAEADEENKPKRQASGNVSLEEAWGLYRFKSGFGGQVVNYPGAFDYVYSPARYWLWTKVVPRVLGAKRRLGD